MYVYVCVSVCVHMCMCVYVCMHMYLCIFLGTDKPSHKLLRKYVINEVAPYWHTLGEMLLKEGSVHMLQIIEENYPRDVQRCCRNMFEYWLNIDTEASWNKLIAALKEIDQNQLIGRIEKDVLKGTSLIM